MHWLNANPLEHRHSLLWMSIPWNAANYGNNFIYVEVINKSKKGHQIRVRKWSRLCQDWSITNLAMYISYIIYISYLLTLSIIQYSSYVIYPKRCFGTESFPLHNVIILQKDNVFFYFSGNPMVLVCGQTYWVSYYRHFHTEWST